MSEFTPNFFRRSIILVGALRSIILALTCIHNWRSMKKNQIPKWVLTLQRPRESYVASSQIDHLPGASPQAGTLWDGLRNFETTLAIPVISSDFHGFFMGFSSLFPQNHGWFLTLVGSSHPPRHLSDASPAAAAACSRPPLRWALPEARSAYMGLPGWSRNGMGMDF